MHAEARTRLVDGSAWGLAEVMFGWATGPGSPCEPASGTCSRAIELVPDRTTSSLCPARVLLIAVLNPITPVPCHIVSVLDYRRLADRARRSTHPTIGSQLALTLAT